MKYLLMALVGTQDGRQYTQLITYMNEEQRMDKSFIDKAIKKFASMLGDYYFIIKTWIE